MRNCRVTSTRRCSLMKSRFPKPKSKPPMKTGSMNSPRLNNGRVRQMVFDDVAAANTAFERVSAGEDFAAVAEDLLGWSETDTQLGLVSRRDLRRCPCRERFRHRSRRIHRPGGVRTSGILSRPRHRRRSLPVVRRDLAELAETPSARRLQSESAIDLIFEKANVLEDLLRPAPQLMKRSARLAARP